MTGLAKLYDMRFLTFRQHCAVKTMQIDQFPIFLTNFRSALISRSYDKVFNFIYFPSA